MAGRTVTVAIPTDIKTLDPHEADDSVTFNVLNQIVEGLTGFAPDSIEIVPVLAESWTTSMDFRKWTFVLRKGVEYSDGTPVTVADVVTAFRGAKDFGGEVAPSGERQIVFSLREPNAHLAATLAQLYYPVARSTREGLLGTGPFKVESRRPGRELVLVRNEHDRRHSTVIDRIVFKVVPFMTLIPKGLADGEIDFSDAITPSMLPVLRKNAGLRLEFRMGLNTGFLAINVERPPLSDPRVRAAVAHAIDRAPLVQRFFPTGYGEAASTLLPPALISKRPPNFLPFDPDKARSLLTGSSYKKEVIRFFPSWAPRPYMPDPPAIAVEIAKQLRAVGFIIQEEATPAIEDFFQRQSTGDFELMLSGWIADDTVAYNFLADNLGSSRIGRTNIPRYTSVAFDLALSRTRRTAGADADLAVLQSEEVIQRDVPIVPLFHGPQIAAVGKRVTGTILHPAALLRIWELKLA